VGQGLPYLTGEVQDVLNLSAFGKRGGQAGGTPGHFCAPDGEAQPSPTFSGDQAQSVTTSAGTGARITRMGGKLHAQDWVVVQA
jgi:hypothetical protein